ncbi:ABC transporter A family member 7 [Citrus sinensis]|uniref:ABC transporter A family member 7 n=1 Tax=Citrus sinensis TaxID=2711 RepID=A0ACB8LR16_CITSI|nr:ABC transporter A family member 7 [Citrus sinensis]
MSSSLAPEPASFCTQTNALLRKNLTFQVLLDRVVSNSDDYKCGCNCVRKSGSDCVEEKCGIEYSTPQQAQFCPIPRPPQWPPMLQVPAPEYRAVRNDFLTYPDLPNESCRIDGSCPATILLTGNNQSFGQTLNKDMFKDTFSENPSDVMASLADNVLGSDSKTEITNYVEPAFVSDSPIYTIQSQCRPDSSFVVPVKVASINISLVIRCLQGLNLWRKSSSEINDELYRGFRKGNSKRESNEILAAYDFLNSDLEKFNVNIWYNSTYKNDTGNVPIGLLRVPRSINLASNAYLRSLLGPGTQILFDFVKEMPKTDSKLKLDVSSIIGTLFFTWVVLQLFPVRLRFFTLNSYGIQFVFYIIYINLQIALAFLVAALFSNVKTASVIGYICVFGTGLLGAFLLQSFVEDPSFPRRWITAMELYPGFALYRGLYEFGTYSFRGHSMGTDGMSWADLSDSENGMKEVLIIMFVEWLLLLGIAYYVDKILSSGGAKGPLYFLQNFKKKPRSSFRKPSLGRQDSKVFVSMEKPDVTQERERVEQLLLEPGTSHAIISDNLRKIYPGRDGNPEKVAVNGLSLALPSGECFGMLGPNGAGKTTFISMMIGITRPTSGTAYVQGLDIRTDMDRIYTSMGVCPQEDLLWETLTGREHLLFYGRLKNLKGPALTQAVEESLKSVNLFHGGVADKQAGKYSGGMKRRLSVAISLIGNPKVVYMDEPSTGLDPASRNNLWNVVKRAKQGRAIILTTHSMEEAEALCDRLGIFVDGSLQCIGNPKELKARYGGSYVFTMTTSADHEEEVESMAKRLSPGANKIYQISGTQKFELPKQEVRVSDVFQAVEEAKSRFTVFAWGLADTTLEDVFIKVARHAQAFEDLP